MSQDGMAVAILATVTSFAVANDNAMLSPMSALGISAAMGIAGGTVSALVLAGDASLSVRRVAVCVLTTAMVAPMVVFTALDFFYAGSHHIIPVVSTSGIAGVITWPVTDKVAKAFAAVSPKAFGLWLLETARKIIGGGR